MTTSDIPDPLTLLREQHRAALDRQSELTAEARALTARIHEIVAEAELVTIRAKAYATLVAALTKTGK